MSKYYVTTSIPYVNADPHIGFALEIICADVLARHARARGNEVIFSTGTDEHGGKIAEKAQEAGQDIQTFANNISEHFRQLGTLLNISCNRFIRTTDVGHSQRAVVIWNNLKKDIYKSKYIGWYCTGDEAFFTETIVKANNGICPNHNRPYEQIEEDNYFFRLTKYENRIKKAIIDNKLQILPLSRKKEILSVISGGLEDISISRPKSKIQWGIQVPNDPDQVMYVWFEALMNYITVLGYPENQDFKDYWPANVHVIGKDILRFHAAIWPAMLMSLEQPLPKKLYVHGFITIDGKKISKTIGNVISPTEVIKKYGLDTLRYYLLRHIPSYDDGDFSWEKIESAYNNELANELGNTVQRTAAMIDKYLDGVIGKVQESGHDTNKYEESIEACRFDKALDDIWEHIKALNQYIDEEKPWQINKEKDPSHLSDVLKYQVSTLLLIARLLRPFMPETSDKITKILTDEKIAPSNQTLFPRLDQIDKE